MAKQTVASVHKQKNGQYVAFDREDNILGEAGALNVRGAGVGMSRGSIIDISANCSARVDESLHSDGVLFIE